MSWVWNRVYAVYPDLQCVFELEGTFAVETQQFDLGAQVVAAGGEFFGHKTFYIMDPNQNQFIPVQFVDVNDPIFQAYQQEQGQLLTPVIAAIVNFDEVRFAPPLPASTQWRSDYIGKPPDLSLATNCLLGDSIPIPLQQPLLSYATAEVFQNIDDDRYDSWAAKAESQIMVGIHAVKRRQQQTPQKTMPFPAKGSGQGYRWNVGA